VLLRVGLKIAADLEVPNRFAGQALAHHRRPCVGGLARVGWYALAEQQGNPTLLISLSKDLIGWLQTKKIASLCLSTHNERAPPLMQTPLIHG
jgi:hypothetical protein